MNKKPRVVFVGNGDMSSDLSEHVDSADYVIRSQQCGPHYQGWSGNRTDILHVRPSNEPFGEETARNKLIPQKVTEDCRFLLMVHRFPAPSTELLFKNYPILLHKPLLVVGEHNTREFVHGKAPKIKHLKYNPSCGMALLHHAVKHKLYEQYDLQCVGFSWSGNYLTFQEHCTLIEQSIEQQWQQQGFITFL